MRTMRWPVPIGRFAWRQFLPTPGSTPRINGPSFPAPGPRSPSIAGMLDHWRDSIPQFASAGRRKPPVHDARLHPQERSTRPIVGAMIRCGKSNPCWDARREGRPITLQAVTQCPQLAPPLHVATFETLNPTSGILPHTSRTGEPKRS